MQDARIELYDYWRSSASYRVRIALGLLDVAFEVRTVNLLDASHRSEDYVALNPQGLVPTLLIDGHVLTQSLAILEYLNTSIPGSRLLSDDPFLAFRTRQISHAIAMEIHPVCNLGVVARVAELTAGGDVVKVAWMQEFIGKGLRAVEDLLAAAPITRFCVGDIPTMADCCLIPQLYNAQRWGVSLDGLDRIVGIATACNEVEAFRSAHPDRVKDVFGPN